MLVLMNALFDVGFRNSRFQVCSSLLLRIQNDPILERIVTFEENLILQQQDTVKTRHPKPKTDQTKTMVRINRSIKCTVNCVSSNRYWPREEIRAFQKSPSEN